MHSCGELKWIIDETLREEGYPAARRVCRNVGHRHTPGRSAVSFRTSFWRRRSQSENGRGGYRPRNRYDDGRYYGGGEDYRFGKRPKRPVARRPTAAAAKISAPSYYNYKATALQRVDFTALAAIGQSASLDQATSGTAFREAVAGLAGYELFAEPEIAKALVEYYSANPDFIWVTANEVNERGSDAVRVLGEAASHGLSPADYAINVPAASLSVTDAAARKGELIRFEMALSARVLRYAHDAESGRINPNKHLRLPRFSGKAVRHGRRAENLVACDRRARLARSAAS